MPITEVNHEADPSTQMPRREFIRKSLLASGGTFVGMASVGKFTLPELTNGNKSKYSASTSDDPYKRRKNQRDQNTGGSTGIHRLEKTVQTQLGD